MRYFVYAEDGNKYGPADVSMLNDWIEQGRLLPAMMLEEEGTRHRVAAASIGGLDFYVLDSDEVPAKPAPTFSAEAVAQEPVSVDFSLALAAIIATLCLAAVRAPAGFLAIFTGLFGMMAALKAKERGHPLASVALMANLIALVIWLAARLYMSMR